MLRIGNIRRTNKITILVNSVLLQNILITRPIPSPRFSNLGRGEGGGFVRQSKDQLIFSGHDLEQPAA